MTTDSGLAAELALLTVALDLPGTDIAETLTKLVADVRVAVGSYLGLSIAIASNRSPLDLTVLDEDLRSDDIATSLLIPLSSSSDGSSPTTVELILFAAVPGAFIDLAADLSWITGRPLPEFVLDAHRDIPQNHSGPTPLGTRWTVDQAIGVLIGRGSTPEQAERELHSRAVEDDIELVEAAALILAGLTPLEPDLDVF